MENTQSLSLNDLISAKNIIDLAVSRGAFRGSEIKAVGELYEKIDLFVTSVSSQLEQQAAASNDQDSQQQPTQGDQE